MEATSRSSLLLTRDPLTTSIQTQSLCDTEGVCLLTVEVLFLPNETFHWVESGRPRTQSLTKNTLVFCRNKSSTLLSTLTFFEAPEIEPLSSEANPQTEILANPTFQKPLHDASTRFFNEGGTSSLTEARNVLRVWQGTEQFYDLPRSVMQRRFRVTFKMTGYYCISDSNRCTSKKKRRTPTKNQGR